jgi:hypothetical protein
LKGNKALKVIHKSAAPRPHAVDLKVEGHRGEPSDPFFEGSSMSRKDGTLVDKECLNHAKEVHHNCPA